MEKKKGKKSLTLPEDTYWKLAEYKARARKDTWEEFFEFVFELLERELSGKG